MIKMIEINLSSNFDLIHSIGDVTTILSLIPLVIFGWLVIKSKSIKSFQFQILVFISLYFIGQIIENNNNRITIFSMLPPDTGSQIHVIAAVFFTVMILFRFYYAEPRKKKMIDDTKDDII